MKVRIWASRLLILAVLLMNLMAAFLFISNPQPFARSFELEGLIGDAAIRGIGILFLMWNVPYAFAAWKPVRNKTSFIEAIFMQTIGVIGESLIYINLPAEIEKADRAILRFIIFDSIGLLLLVVGFILIIPILKEKYANKNNLL